ncbi:MAG: IS1595 family transposase [Ruegeria sp.]
MKQTNIRQFYQQFPTDEACLEHLFNARFGQGHVCPKCKREAKWYRLSKQQAYSCEWCGHHIHPMVGTIFEKSRTPLQLWFYAIFLFTTSRHGVSGKELQRQLGVTYKTAWRMAALIREHMAAIDGNKPIGGEGKTVEIDDTMVGGRRKGTENRGYGGDHKTKLIGMVEKGGDIVVEVLPSFKRKDMEAPISEHVLPGTEVHTDEHPGYDELGDKGYTHKSVNHRAKEYVAEDGTTTNAIENFWRHLKCSIKGTHVSVSKKHMERYAKEFEYRFNRRTRPETMLSELLTRFPELRS